MGDFSYLVRFYCNGKERLHVDSAHTLSFGDQEADISLLTPVGAPGVFDNPILTLGLDVRAIPHEEDRMVKIRRANLVIVDDATLVVEPIEPLIFTSADRYRDGAHEVQGSLELGRILRSYILIVADTNHIFTRISIAGFLVMSIRVVLFCLKTIINYVIEDEVGHATFASIIIEGSGAIYDLLNR